MKPCGLCEPELNLAGWQQPRRRSRFSQNDGVSLELMDRRQQNKRRNKQIAHSRFRPSFTTNTISFHPAYLYLKSRGTKCAFENGNLYALEAP